VFLDLCKVFVTVDHVLIKKLQEELHATRECDMSGRIAWLPKDPAMLVLIRRPEVHIVME